MTAKEKILTAIAPFLAQKGGDALSIRSIAKEAGVNHGLVHHYFGSKEQMMIQFALDLDARLLPQLDTLVQTKDRKALIAFVQGQMLRDPGRILSELFRMAPQMPGLMEVVQKIFSQRKELLGRLFGVENPLDKALLAACLFGLMQHRAFYTEAEYLAVVEHFFHGPSLLESLRPKETK